MLLRILLYLILGYLVIKIIKDLLTPKDNRDRKVRGNSQPGKKIHIDENNISDAKFKDIDDKE